MRFECAGRWLEVLESRRLLSAGDLDRAFGKEGIAYYGDSHPALTMAVDHSGRIVVAEKDGVVERFNADGTRDRSFGGSGNGERSVSIDIVGLAVDAQGRIVLAGNSIGGTTWTVSRLNNDGSPDGTFNGTDSYGNYPLPERSVPPSALPGVRGGLGWFALQADGKILLGGFFQGGGNDSNAGEYHGQSNSNVELIRFNSDGTLDRSFGDGGEAITRNGDWTTYGTGRALLIQPDGQIVLVGLVHPAIEGATGYEAVFNSSGVLVSDRYAAASPYTDIIAGTVTSEGKVVITSEQFLAYRQTLLDIDGRQVEFSLNTPLVPGEGYSSGTALSFGGIDAALGTADSKVMLVTGSGNEIALSRVGPDGSPDVTFGFGGTALLKLDVYHDGWIGTESGMTLAETSDGDILIAGNYRGRLFMARVEGGSHGVEDDAPTVAAAPVFVSPVVDSSQDPLRVNVRFFGTNPIDLTTVDEQDILVTGPEGYSALGTFTVGRPAGTERLPLDMTFDFARPASGTFSTGTYTIELVGQVLDTRGRAVPTGVVGRFVWPVGLASPAPADAPFVADVLAPFGPKPGARFMNFVVRYHSAAGVDATTLNDTNFELERADGIHAPARFVSAEASEDGTTLLATYTVGAPRGNTWDEGILEEYTFDYPAEGEYAIRLNVSPLDHAGHTVAGYYGADIQSSLKAQFTKREYGSQPLAELERVDAPAAGQPLRFQVRYTPGQYAKIDLSSIQEKAISVVPANALGELTWATLERAEFEADGSVLASYTVPADAGSGLLGIQVGSSNPYAGGGVGAHDNSDARVPTGLLGLINANYAYRRPSATLLTDRGVLSQRRYVALEVRYTSFNGMRTGMLDDRDLVVTGPDGFRARVRFDRVTDATDPTALVARYFVRLPPGAALGGDYRVTMQRVQVRDKNFKHVSAGVIGAFEVSPMSSARVVAGMAGVASAGAKGVRRKVNEVLE